MSLTTLNEPLFCPAQHNGWLGIWTVDTEANYPPGSAALVVLSERLPAISHHDTQMTVPYCGRLSYHGSRASTMAALVDGTYNTVRTAFGQYHYFKRGLTYPESISKMSTPRAHQSTAVPWPLPWMTSGAKYSGVPHRVQVLFRYREEESVKVQPSFAMSVLCTELQQNRVLALVWLNDQITCHHIANIWSWASALVHSFQPCNV